MMYILHANALRGSHPGLTYPRHPLEFTRLTQAGGDDDRVPRSTRPTLFSEPPPILISFGVRIATLGFEIDPNSYAPLTCIVASTASRSS